MSVIRWYNNIGYKFNCISNYCLMIGVIVMNEMESVREKV